MKNYKTIITDCDIIASSVIIEKETEKAVLFRGDVNFGFASRKRGSFWIAKRFLNEGSMSIDEHNESYVIPAWLANRLEVCYA